MRRLELAILGGGVAEGAALSGDRAAAQVRAAV
jgi:hypothetical protein